MDVFNSLYAATYDLLYADKNYAAEAGFLDEILERHAPQADTLLDLGSGTGRHAFELMQLGYRVTGVERSAEMLAKASHAVDVGSTHTGRQQWPTFHQGDLRSIRLAQTFDVVTSLFHVISYQCSNEDLRAAFTTASVHLASGGLFVFDFWYGPAVLTEQPAVRVKRLQNAQLDLVRIAEPHLRSRDNVVEVNYQVFVRDLTDHQRQEFTEHHEMRYLFLPEIHALAGELGWIILETGEWMTGANPSEKTWGVYTVMKKL